VIAVFTDNRLHVAWVGDSLAVLATSKNPPQLLVEPHKPENEVPITDTFTCTNTNELFTSFHLSSISMYNSVNRNRTKRTESRSWEAKS
jgi:hypothetical protein